MAPLSLLDPENQVSPLRALGQLPWLLYRMVRWGALRGGWLPGYICRHRSFDRSVFPADQPIDIMVLCCDHFEPARKFGETAAAQTVRSWCAEYETLVTRHNDSDGRSPQHTWFYRYEYPNAGCLSSLSQAAFRGLGEIEFHLHHGHDTHETMRATLREGLDWFNRFGAMRTAEERPQQRFAYLAGNSALDNGAGDDALSGCDTELAALRETGCFADFTFPSLGSPAQPRMSNCIYYAREDGRPKSYDCGVPVKVGRPGSGDLMIFQGPIAIDWREGRLDEAALENSSPPHPRRLANWLSANVHVPGRPEWIFIKLQTHAMQNRETFLSADNDAVFAAMEKWWNRPPFRLHYVTAREAYNIVKAAEAGKSGDPNDYRDFEIAPPANRVVYCDAPWLLRSYTPECTHVEVAGGGAARLVFARGSLASVAGHIREVEAHYRDGVLIDLRIVGQEPYEIISRDRSQPKPTELMVG